MKPKFKVLIIAGQILGQRRHSSRYKNCYITWKLCNDSHNSCYRSNTTGVKSIVSIKPQEISRQIDFSAKDIKPNAVKIGMLHSKQVIHAVIKSLNKIKIKKVVLDPVMVAKGGAKLVNNAAIVQIKKKLIKKILLITPNIPEAEILTNTKINTTSDMIKAGEILISQGAKNVLIKGGHLKSKQMIDILLNNEIIKVFKSKKYISKNTHGTGCTLSTAIATYLSCGKDLIKSCELGIKYVNEAIKSNLNLGKGNGPINHLNSFEIKKKFK